MMQPAVQLPTYRPIPVYPPGPPVPAPGFLAPPPQNRFAPFGEMAATLTISSAATIGATMRLVSNGTITPAQAVLDGLAKGTAAGFILSSIPRRTVLDVVMTAAALAGSAYLIDRAVKTSAPQKNDEASQG